MEFISLNRIMERLMVSPAMKNLGYGTAAAFVKDFASINSLQPIYGTKFVLVRTDNYRAWLPPDVMHVENVFVCGENLDPEYFENDKLGASLDSSIVRDTDKTFYGGYKIQDDIIYTDSKDPITLEIEYTGLRCDEEGFPLLPYDGSLMQAVTNYVKWQYFTILGENNQIQQGAANMAHREYCWYIGQYQQKEITPTYDEAVSWANSWQRLLDSRNQGYESKHLRQGAIRRQVRYNRYGQIKRR